MYMFLSRNSSCQLAVDMFACFLKMLISMFVMIQNVRRYIFQCQKTRRMFTTENALVNRLRHRPIAGCLAWLARPTISVAPGIWRSSVTYTCSNTFFTCSKTWSAFLSQKWTEFRVGNGRTTGLVEL